MREWPRRRSRQQRHLQVVREGQRGGAGLPPGAGEQAVSIVDAEAVGAEAVRARALADPVAAALMAEYVESLESNYYSRSQMLCAVRDDEVLGLCLTAGNLVPLGLPPEAWHPMAAHLRRRGQRFSSLVGAADQVLGLWPLLRRHLGPPRDIRADQPSLLIDHPPAIAPDPRVRPGRPEDLDILIPACVAMFTEEVGYSPLTAGGGYERRVRALVDQGRSLVRIEDGPDGPRVVFKAELGTVGLGVAQVQGVWVHPDYRGQGLSAPGMAAVVEYARAHHAPAVSLYVNAYNTTALATYRRTGFRQVGTFATILL